MNTENRIIPAIQAVLAAGDKILGVYHSPDFNITQKKDKSPLTLADRLADEQIRKILSVTPFPILSEESGQHDFPVRSAWKNFWLVDPLDGTKEFISKNDEFTVNIALIDHGHPILGVIYLPVTGILYFGIAGKGAWRTEQEKLITAKIEDTTTLFSVSTRLPLDTPTPATVMVSRSHLSEATSEYIRNLEKKTGTLKRVTAGSSLKLCRIAEGTAGIYPRLGPTMEWDIAAGVAIVHAAGGSVTTPDGQPMAFNKPDLLNPWFIAVSEAFRKKYPDYL